MQNCVFWQYLQILCCLLHGAPKKHKPNRPNPTEHCWFLPCDHRKCCEAAEMRFPLHQQPYLPLLPGWAGGTVGPGPLHPATGWAVPAPGVPPGTSPLPMGRATALPAPPGPCPAPSAAGAEPRTCGGSPVAEEHRVSPEAAGRQEAPRPQHTLKLSPLPSLQAPTDICPCSQLAETWHTAARTHRPRSAAPRA